MIESESTFGRLPVASLPREVHAPGAVVWLTASVRMPCSIILYLLSCENESNPWILPSVFPTRDEFISRVASSSPSPTIRNAGVFWSECSKPRKSLRSQSRVNKGSNEVPRAELGYCPRTHTLKEVVDRVTGLLNPVKDVALVRPKRSQMERFGSNGHMQPNQMAIRA